MEGKIDKSEDYEKFHEIRPINVKAGPSILLRDEDYPWLQRNKQSTQVKKKWMVHIENSCNGANLCVNQFKINHFRTYYVGEMMTAFQF